MDEELLRRLQALMESDNAQTADLATRLNTLVQNEDTRTAAGPQLPGEIAEFGQGLSFGFLDEGAAALRAGAGEIGQALGLMEPRPFSEVYDEGLQAQRIERDEAYERAPLTTIASGLIGGVSTIPISGGLGIGNAASQGARVGLPAMALMGAGAGALGGFGEGEGGLSQRLDSAAIGAALGGAAAPLLQGVMNAGTTGARVIRDTFGTNPQRTAGERVLTAFADDEIALDDVLAFLEREATDPRGGVAADASGPNSSTMSLLEAAAQRPGPQMRNIANTMEERVASAPDRIAGDFRAAFGGADRDFYGTLEELNARRYSPQVQEAYERAYAAGPIWTDNLEQIWDNPTVQRAMRNVRQIIENEAAAEGVPPNWTDYAIMGFNEAGDPIIGGAPNTRTWDLIKRALDQELARFRDPTTGRLVLNGNPEAQSILDLRNSLVRQVDELNPLYAEARGLFAGPSEMIDAMELGADFLRRSPDEIRGILRNMTQSERDAYATGVYRRLLDTMGSLSDNANTAGDRRIWGSAAQRDRLRAVVNALAPDQASADNLYNQLLDSLTRERAMGEVRNQVVRNSATARRTAAQEMLQNVPAGMIFDILTGMPGVGTATMAGRAGANVLGDRGTRRLQDEIGRLLTQSSPEALEAALQPAMQGATALPYFAMPRSILERYTQATPFGALGVVGNQ